MAEAKNVRGRFFAVDKRLCEQVCELGMNAAVAYLVLACGTDRNNRITEWSVHAIEKYTGISRARARAAVETLMMKGKGQWGCHDFLPYFFVGRKSSARNPA